MYPERNELRALITFLVSVLVFSIPFWLLGWLVRAQLMPGLPVSALAVVVPTIAAGVAVFRERHDPRDVLRLVRRALDGLQVPSQRWMGIYLVLNPLIAIVAYGLISATKGPLPVVAWVPSEIALMFGVFLLGALLEEIGWSGFATERLTRHWGVIKVGLSVGSVWAAWHFIPLLQAHRSVSWIAWWSLGTVCSRVIMVWLYVHAGRSVFAAALFHAMGNLCWQLFPVHGAYYDPRVFGIVTLLVAFGCLAMTRLLPNPQDG